MSIDNLNRCMKIKSLRILATLALFGIASVSNGQSVFDSFDTYTLGSVGGQGGWEGWTGNNAVAGTVTTDQASSGTQSLRVVAGNDTVRPFSGYAGGQWSLSLMQYVPSTSSGDSWVILMNNYPATLNWSVDMNIDISGNAVWSGEVPTASVPLVKDQWVPIRFDIDLTANSVSSYYNNTFLATHAWQSGGLNELRALDLYPDEGGASGFIAQVGAVYYDSLQLTQVPEPTALALLALAGLATLIRRRNA